MKVETEQEEQGSHEENDQEDNVAILNIAEVDQENDGIGNDKQPGIAGTIEKPGTGVGQDKTEGGNKEEENGVVLTCATPYDGGIPSLHAMEQRKGVAAIEGSGGLPEGQ